MSNGEQNNTEGLKTWFWCRITHTLTLLLKTHTHFQNDLSWKGPSKIIYSNILDKNKNWFTSL